MSLLYIFFLELQVIISYTVIMQEKNDRLDTLLTKDVCFLFRIFDNQLRLVGGCVRDFLLHKKVHDIDMATPLTPAEMIQILEKNKIAYFLTGLKHGTITVVINHIPYEITTLRADRKTDGRHANVAFLKDYQQDALRRDFTINALYMDNLGQINDYTNGIQDLKNKKTRFIGVPNERICEDYLRILRYFRFVARFGVKNLDEESFNACVLNKQGLKTLSIERIREEFLKLLIGPFVIDSLQLMAKGRILDELISCYRIEKLKRFIYFYPQSTALERLAVLTDSNDVLHWKWSKLQKKQLILCRQYIDIPQNINNARYLMWQLGKSMFLFHLNKQRLEKPMPLKQYYRLKNLKVPYFNIKGLDFQMLGFSGTRIGVLLKLAEKKWVKMGFPKKKSLVIDSVLLYTKRSKLFLREKNDDETFK